VEMGCVKVRGSDGQERRKFLRTQDNIFIFCRLRPRHRIMEWIAKDISEMGLRFESEEFVRPLNLIDVELYQPFDYFRSRIVSIYALAKVVWIKEIEGSEKHRGNNKYIGGLKFTRITRRDRNIIADYVKERFEKRG